jgi:NAD(P)-dependent dehydrogenase (short-subunit alcohol dehydrogenase family)
MAAPRRVALVTGGTRGIGRSVTERLAASGTAVAAAFARDAEAAARLRECSERSGWQVSIHQADVSDPDACKCLVSDVLARYGRLDHLVNNAGAVTELRYGDITADEWDRQIAVNLSAAFFLAQAALVPMTAAGFGRIVNVGSVSAVMGSSVQIPYAAAKAGLTGLTLSLARAVARKGITVNCVIPGSIETELPQSLRYTKRDRVTELIPAGRWGRPAEVAHAISFLLAEHAAYITGAIVTVDGGMSMGGVRQ